MTRVSVIIPTLNEAGALDATLRQFDALPGVWEVIVADSGSSDGTLAIAAAHTGVRVVPAPRGRGAGVNPITLSQVMTPAPRGRGAGMNGGAALATGDILLFLHADTALPPEAYALVTRALADSRTSATAFRLRLDRDDWPYRVVPLASRLRVCVQRTFFGDQAIAVRRADFERIGGYPEAALMEDVDLSRRLRRLGRLRLLDASVVTSARRFEQGGVFRTLALMAGLQALYACRVPAERLARWYGIAREQGTGVRDEG